MNGLRLSRRQLLLAIGLLALASAAAYHNALSAPFVFDDQFAIVENPTIRHLDQLGDVLRPPPYAAGAAGRPLVNLTLAINYAFGGLQPRGYHALNIGLHALAALALFGLVRRTLEKSGLAADSFPLALITATVWAVHPLLTESVTCVIQRNEILAGIFYLLTLYCFVRGAEPSGGKIWLPLAGLACLLGVTAKEIVVSAPLIVLLYDRTFVTGTFSAAWRTRRGFYLALAGTWLVLAGLMLSSQNRGTVGFGLGVSAWDYLLIQCRAIVIYLKLALWPHPLVIDYGTDLATRLGDVVPQGLMLITLAIATALGLRRRSALGFLGACFFAILAPSSSFVPLVTQPIAEHRMYLPLAVIVTLAVVGLRAVAGRRSLTVWPALAFGLGALSIQRNGDYRSEIALTESALAVYPSNDRAYLNLGTFATRENRPAAAIAYYEKALHLNPAAADTHFNLAAVLEQTGRLSEALDHYREAVRLRPGVPTAQYHLGLALVKASRFDEAIASLTEALRLQPTSTAACQSLAQAHTVLGNTDARAGRLPAAIAHYETAIQLDPRDARTQNNLANALSQTGRPADAIAHYEAALAVAPDYAEAHFNLAAELLAAGRSREARTHLIEVVRLKPDDAEARQALAQIDAAAAH
jgi:tetratricopeptide (TPR) repeat protein